MPVLLVIAPRLWPWALRSRAYSIFSGGWATGRPTCRPLASATARAFAARSAKVVASFPSRGLTRGATTERGTPMCRAVTRRSAQPRGVDPDRVERILAVIPKRNLRDRVLFTLIARTGARASEALGVHDDLTLTPDDEHVTVHGKGGRSRTILLDDPALVALIRRYLRATRYAHGPLFRAAKNHICGPLRYASAQELWTKYNQLCAHAVGSASATGATARPATPDRPARTGPAARRVGAATPRAGDATR